MRIFLDDERLPPRDGLHYEIVRSFDSFCNLLVFCVNVDIPVKHVSFDHDLGSVMNGMDCAKLLVNLDMDHSILSPSFTFYVHSQNPVGKQNIERYLSCYFFEKGP